MTGRSPHDGERELDALLRRAAIADPPPADLGARVRARLAGAASERRRRPVVAGRLRAAAGLAGGLAAAAALAMLLLPESPAAPVDRDSPSPGDGRVAVSAPPSTPRAMRAAPVSLTSPVGARVLDAGDATPISLESSDPTITIVWMLPGSTGDQSEVH